jgi:membrane fusion protein (multidrug efflux system)
VPARTNIKHSAATHAAVAEVRPKRPIREVPQDNQHDAKGWARSIKARLKRHPYAAAAAGILVIVVCIGGVLWWLNARNYESTDDAFIDARIVPISSQIAGQIVDLEVTDNQRVKAGGVLFRIDDRDYRAALDEAKALVEQADATIANLGAQIDAQQSRIDEARREVTQAHAALTFAQEQNARAQDLVLKGVGTVEAAQQAASQLKEEKAAVNAAEANQVAAEKQIAVLKSQQQVARAERDKAAAQEEQAEVNLARTVVRAPVDGIATKITAAKGAYAQPGQTVIMWVPTKMWVTANFKETQLDLMRPGQPVDISIDAYPGRTFHGHVASIQAGSGAAFSLLPPENATGNYVKIVQRVPVKITFDKLPDVYIGPGMSVVPTVKVR